MPPLDVRDRLSPDEVEAVRELVDRVTVADGVGPLSEHVLLHLPGGGDVGITHLLVRDDERLLGYAHLDVTDRVAGSSAELAVDPSARRAGHGRTLVEALLAGTPDGRLRLWAHGDSAAAAALAARHDFARTRVLLQMTRPLLDPLPEVVLPDGVRVRTFEPGRDEPAWLEVNARAFADHPEQGRWTRADLDLRLAESWFDPKGFFLAERDGRLAGFHWTKVHGGSPGNGGSRDGGHGHEPVGEVYVVGVDPAEQGRGLGPALTLLGLHSLRDRGLRSVLLYVDDDNRAAVTTYERLGFTTSAVDVCYART
ncbi:MAG TPA: mycothiol synthase [Mycobacteriales bacterium]|nr:mycothiol synthase [Mycobacteriales bacterium]